MTNSNTALADVLGRASKVKKTLTESSKALPVTPAAGARKAARGARNNVSADSILQYQIYDENHPLVQSGECRPDNALTVAVKQLVNSKKITRTQIEKHVGEGKLFSDSNEAYNLEYGLRLKNRNTNFEYAQKWAIICGLPKITISFSE
jgi:hypothetical protein